MATYTLSNVTIKKITAGPNAGKEYLSATVNLKKSIYGGVERRVAFFNTGIVNMWKPLLPVGVGGTAQVEQQIPEELKELHAKVVTWRAPVNFHKMYITNVGDKKAGDYICDKKGNPLVFNSLELFCIMRFDDDTNTWEYGDKQSPDVVGSTHLASYCEQIGDTNIATDEQAAPF